MMKQKRGLQAIVATLLVLVLLNTTTSWAKDETLTGEPPAIDQTPTILSQTMDANEINTVIEIPAAQDTFVTSNLPDANWCNSDLLRLGYNKDAPDYGAVRPILRFDLSSIPTDAAINSAQFVLYMEAATPLNDSSMLIDPRHLLTDWDQCLVTWNNHEPAWGAIVDSTWLGSTTGWIETDATQLVQDWLYGTVPNYGAILLGDETVRERERIFYSSRDGGGRYPRLTVDYTVQVDQEPPVVSMNPLPQWSQSDFTVSWSGTDPGGSGIAYYDVEYRLPGQEWELFLYHTDATSAEYQGGANGLTYEFRARGVDNAGNVQAWTDYAQAATTVDSIPPTASVNPLPPYELSSAFWVSWTGSDNSGGSGINYYDVQYQADNGQWLHWQVRTTATSAYVTGLHDGVRYGFRARAADYAGNVQPWSVFAQAWTTVNTQGPIATVLQFDPPVTAADSFLVSWEGSASPGMEITGFDIRYRYRNEGWILWLQGTQNSEDLFTDLRAQDGSYCFEARATDSVNRTSDWMGEACMMVDRLPPFLKPAAFLPTISRADVY